MTEATAVRRAVRSLFDPRGCPDPYPHYAVLRTHAPALRLPDGRILLSRHAECDRVLRNPAFRVEDEQWMDANLPGAGEHPAVHSLMAEMVNCNPPHHERLRRLVGTAFSPRRIAELRPAVTALVDSLLDRLAAGAGAGAAVDFMSGFALPLPITVIGELLGLPEADRAWFAPRVEAVTRAIEQDLTGEALKTADRAVEELWERLGDLVEQRRRDPRPDLVSTLIAAREADGDRLSRRELLANLVLLYSAGYETTSNLLGNGLATLLSRPELLARLRAESGRIGPWVEEMLRHTPPITLASRWAAEDTELAGVPLRRGAEVLLLLGSANRDESRYPDPDRFDPDRPVAANLAFGAGAHYCLGAVLARMEAEIAFPALLARFPDIALAQLPERRQGFGALNGFAELPLLLGTR
ncbi:cytochrome P450 [Streptomyces sp. NRRL WC-3742]|uniref:cytochrome P450 n=1 Tax=Streptomyces sp. NRRL WC-3742 TaxID=1463934 RepID=UPI0004C4EA4D|nr:cytochrome P450 [Streptomyces sp. NRRL WC-3742]